MISKFLLAENPINSNDLKEYIIHTQKPKFLAEVIETKLGYRFEILQEYEPIDVNTLDNLKTEMLDWWNEYLDWEDDLEDN